MKNILILLALVSLKATAQNEAKKEWENIIVVDVPVGKWSEKIEIKPGTEWEASSTGHVQVMYGWQGDFELQNDCPPGCTEHPNNAKKQLAESKHQLVRRYQSLDGMPLKVTIKTRKL